MHDFEAPTPWYPVIHDLEPDIEAFYKDWLQLPVLERADLRTRRGVTLATPSFPTGGCTILSVGAAA